MCQTQHSSFLHKEKRRQVTGSKRVSQPFPELAQGEAITVNHTIKTPMIVPRMHATSLSGFVFSAPRVPSPTLDNTNNTQSYTGSCHVMKMWSDICRCLVVLLGQQWRTRIGPAVRKFELQPSLETPRSSQVDPWLLRLRK